jgi:hypothetical protein
MEASGILEIPSMRDKVGEAEWQTREDLAIISRRVYPMHRTIF